MKKIITFVDANKNKAIIEIAIKDGRFSMSGDIGGSLGQIYDSISPDNEGQELLLDLWKKYHLNDMKPGTPRQMELVKGLSYENAIEELSKHSRDGNEVPKDIQKLIDELSSEVDVLKFIQENSSNEVLNFFISRYTKDGKKLGVPRDIIVDRANELNQRIEELKSVIDSTLIYDTLPNGDLYKYGSGWLTEELPEDIEDLVDECCTLIEEYETERKGDTLISDLDKEEALTIIREVSDDDANEIYAICCMFDLTANEIDDIAIEGHNRICVQGVDYLFGTDSEMDTAWDEALDNYLEECVYPELSGHLQNSFDDEAWKSDARMDGRGHSLNHYDGGELSYNVGEVYYYAYRQ